MTNARSLMFAQLMELRRRHNQLLRRQTQQHQRLRQERRVVVEVVDEVVKHNPPWPNPRQSQSL